MTNVKCTRCGTVNPVANEICKACGAELRYVPTTPHTTYPQPPPEPDISSGATFSPLIRRFDSVTDALGPTLTLLTKNFWPIVKLVFFIFAPFEVFRALSVRQLNPDWQLGIGIVALQIFCHVLIAPAVIYTIMKVLETGVAPGLNEAYGWSLGKLGKLFLCAAMALTLQFLGTLLFIIPGIIIGTAYELVYPIAVLENHSASDTLKRSWNLTKGRRWRIFGAVFLMGLLVGVVSIPVSIGPGFLSFLGADLWPLEALAALLLDIVNQGFTILSLVIYLSIMRRQNPLAQSPSVIE